MDFSIREATQQDYEGLCKVFAEGDLLHSQVLPEIFSRPEEPSRPMVYLKGILEDENAAMFAAESGGQIIGCIHVFIRESPDIPIMVKRRYAYISDLAVLEGFQRSGIGKALMDEVERWAVQRNISQFELNVWDFNKNAIAFFNELGYTPSCHIMAKSV